jgi:3-hydroxybutyryl-CoA dehydrogenase
VTDALEDLAACHFVIEAIPENLELKRNLFQSLEPIVGEKCLLATNTSSLSVTAIAAGCRLPGRVGGFHFFSPVPLMKIVEVIDGVLTEPWVGKALTELAIRMGHTPVRAKDTPGFIVNHAGRGFGTEALHIYGEGVAEFYEIDRILRDAAGFRMGPFELFDLIGLDVSHPVIASIYHQYNQEPRFRPSPITGPRVEAGLLGRKSGRGFYTYRDNVPDPMPAVPVPESRPSRVWVSHEDPDAYALVSTLVAELVLNCKNKRHDVSSFQTYCERSCSCREKPRRHRAAKKTTKRSGSGQTVEAWRPAWSNAPESSANFWTAKALPRSPTISTRARTR